ncbi:hypothetical protein NW762_003284 [Fusarium torreyae]|uniref:Uncharacterized protein n=1 Tax=Fusarium torreyae TaxID=1237075 RepID=A0A9W8VHK0_9HYPO|nr:hypothetical protein NW762_003284 [Fusarium torreyae]
MSTTGIPSSPTEEESPRLEDYAIFEEIDRFDVTSSLPGDTPIPSWQDTAGEPIAGTSSDARLAEPSPDSLHKHNSTSLAEHTHGMTTCASRQEITPSSDNNGNTYSDIDKSLSALRLKGAVDKTTTRTPTITGYPTDDHSELDEDDDEVTSIASDSTVTLSDECIVETSQEGTLKQHWIYHWTWDYFKGLIQQWWGIRAHTGCSNARQSTSSDQRSSASSDSIGSSNGTKRKEHTGSDFDKGQQDELRIGKRGRNSEHQRCVREFACPFCKKSLQRYQSCATWGTTRISRMKQHVGRRHRDEIDDLKKARLKQRSTRGSSEDQWYEVFSILFPQQRPLPLSPSCIVAITSTDANNAVNILHRTILEDPVINEQGEWNAQSLRNALRRGMGHVFEELERDDSGQDNSLRAPRNTSEQILEEDHPADPVIPDGQTIGQGHLASNANGLGIDSMSSTTQDSVQDPDENISNTLEEPEPSINEPFPSLINDEPFLEYRDTGLLDTILDEHGFSPVLQVGQDSDEGFQRVGETIGGPGWDPLAILDRRADLLLSSEDFY